MNERIHKHDGVKETRIHIAWFHLHKVQKQVKQVCGVGGGRGVAPGGGDWKGLGAGFWKHP